VGVINLQIKQEFQANFNEKILQAWVRGTLNYLEVEDCDLSIVIGNNSEIHQLNREYRHIDAPTDVLSFVYDMIDPETETRYLGDIIISAEKVFEQAEQAGHSSQFEACTLVVHGILHLLGYDHVEISDEAVMFPLQEKILKVVFNDEI
jgi:probable rRNA maturation factor